MFTGIVEGMATLAAVSAEGSNRTFFFRCDWLNELSIDQSIAHNGVCLTVDGLQHEAGTYSVTAIAETLQRTNLGQLRLNEPVNLERCLAANGRFDGHIVQGHVDQVGTCQSIADMNGSWQIGFSYDASLGNMTVEKGSICVNGVSLTVVDSAEGYFSVAIIPYTWQHTNFHRLQVGSIVNLEFDILGKYVQKLMATRFKSN